MLLVMPVNLKGANVLPENYNHSDLYSRLYFQRSDVPAITHIDYSARVQTVNKNTNERFWKLILMSLKKLLVTELLSIPALM